MLQKQTKIILCVALFFIAHTATAQVTDFKLSDFKYRTNGFKALGVSVEGGAFGESKKNSSLLSLNSNLSISPSLSYMHNYSTNNRVLNFNFQTDGYLSKSGSSNINIKNKRSDYGLENLFNIEEKIYKNKYFIGFGGEGRFSFENKTEKKQTKSVNSAIKFKVNPFLGIGKGRIENVSNAQMALFILEDLYKAGKIKNKVSAENTLAFANLITQVYNRRIFDFRKRRMVEIEQIDSFLVANKILTVNDVRAINIISDNWSYAIQPARTESNTLNISPGLFYQQVFDGSQVLLDTYFERGILEQTPRLSGRQIYFRVTPQFINVNVKKKDSVATKKDATNLKAIDFFLTYDDYKTIKLKWGLHKYANVLYSTGSAISDFDYNFNIATNTGTKGSFILGNIGVELGYYPNSRTSLVAKWNLGVDKSNVESISTGGINYNLNRIYSGINVTTNYFLNYNSKITGSFGFQIIKDKATPIFVSSILNIGYNVYIF
jgi:hypothetical protein